MTESMATRRAESRKKDAAEAITDLVSELDSQQAALTVLFCSPSYDRVALSAALGQVAPGAPIIGCTSAGEIGPSGYLKESMTGVSFGAADFTAESTVLCDLHQLTTEQVNSSVRDVRDRLAARGITNSSECFALLLVDGLSVAEEMLSYRLQQALGETPLVGGSAGDDLNFGSTFVFSAGNFRQDAAVLVIIHTERPFEVFKAQHFLPSDVQVVITEAEPEKRTVSEINGEPAAQELAELIGVDGPAGLTQAVLARNPLMLQLGDQWFIRSVQRVNDDGSITLYCGIEEGLVLAIGRGYDLVDELTRQLSEVSSRLGGIQLTLACDCIQRKLELEETQSVDAASAVLINHQAVGFSTYGEQFGATHVNQTLTGIAIA